MDHSCRRYCTGAVSTVRDRKPGARLSAHAEVSGTQRSIGDRRQRDRLNCLRALTVVIIKPGPRQPGARNLRSVDAATRRVRRVEPLREKVVEPRMASRALIRQILVEHLFELLLVDRGAGVLLVDLLQGRDPAIRRCPGAARTENLSQSQERRRGTLKSRSVVEER